MESKEYFNQSKENIVDRIEEKFMSGEDFNFMQDDIEESKQLKGFNVYRWHCIYGKGEEILYVGAESISEANLIVKEDLKKFNSTNGEVVSFEKMIGLKALQKGVLGNY